MSKIYDKAHELKQALAEDAAFVQLQDLHKQIAADDIARKMFDNFRKLQMSLQQKQMQGMDISPEEAEQAQKQFELVSQHTLISKLMETEQQMSMIIADVNKIITEPLEEIHGHLAEEDE
ncbi:YlbF family regulator [Bacillus sp. FSL W7-1360]